MMILTVKALVGEAGDLGPKKLAWDYNRVVLLTLAWLTGLMAFVGIGGLGWNLYQANNIGVVVSLLIAVIGIYLVLGIVREILALEVLSKHMSKLSEAARGETLKSMLEANSSSMFRLVESLLRLVENLLGGKSAKT